MEIVDVQKLQEIILNDHARMMALEADMMTCQVVGVFLFVGMIWLAFCVFGRK